MTVMSTTSPTAAVETVAREAGLSEEQTLAFRNVIASMAMEGMPLTLEETRVGAEVAAGRIGFDTARQKLGA